MASKLEEAREIINQVDRQMAKLFVERMRAAELVYAHKKEFGLPILDQKREDAVIAANSALVEDDTLREYYVDFLKDTMAISRAYQSRMQQGLRVAYSGVEGAFAHIAAGRIFPDGERVAYGDFEAAYNAVLAGECDVCVLPIENSYAGEVGQTVDLLFTGTLFVNGIYELSVHQNLLGLPSATVEGIRTVRSHPQALSQCRDYIEMRGYRVEEESNTAAAARRVAEEGDPSSAVIASAETAALYGLKILEGNINKSGENTTRFAVLSKAKAKHPAFTGTVLLFTVKHEAGSLANAIGIIGKYGFNMTALRSRPMKKHSWQYYFYVEIDGSVDSEKGEEMLRALGAVCDVWKVAGTFAPHAEL